MKFFNKRSLTLFIFSTLFLIIFYGIYWLYEIYFSSYVGQTNYEWYSFSPNGKFPSKIRLAFSGFRNMEVIIHSMLMSFILCILDRLFMPSIAVKYKFLNIIITAFSWTVVLGSIYLIYSFIGNKQVANLEPLEGMNAIKSHLVLLLILYIISALPIAWIINKSTIT